MPELIFSGIIVIVVLIVLSIFFTFFPLGLWISAIAAGVKYLHTCWYEIKTCNTK
mgnify:CR=1 FL=1